MTRAAGTLDSFETQGTARDLDIPLAIVMAACFLPYINLGPLSAPSQIQPWAALLAWGWVAVKVLTTGLRISTIQWILLAFALWFMLFVYAGEGFELETYFRRSAAFLLSAGIFLAGQHLTPATLWKALKLTLPLWLLFAVLRYVSSSLYFDLVTPLVPTVVDSTERGTSSLAPEATDFGFTMAVMLVLCMITRRRLVEEGVATEKWPLWVATAGALLSQSGTGYLGLALIGVLYLLTRPPGRYGRPAQIVAAILVALSAFVLLGAVSSSTVRGIDLLRTALYSPNALMDTTLSYRVAHNAVGFLGMVDTDLRGYGAGAFVNEAPGVYSRHSLGNTLDLNLYYESAVPATLSQSPVSHFAVIMLEFGIIGIAYIFVVFGFAVKSEIPFKAIAVAVLITTWANSFGASWPPFWVLIGVMMSPYFRARVAPLTADSKISQHRPAPPREK
ncbi:hypothetical protein [Mycolicibacterium frederiksbergense]|uniref:Uncharacterized protein n=1 Tax=Mycolicibacterium frederiksbergense TaxID=117567 RepID=A0A6H0S1V7_9MYCO|nr:hypothetical protein [Mycolicibacterium frederiksbergense]QIV81156.1 hypothetical protein EXE63_09810 [Mycolicibacterium frederiksbergense]